MNDVTFNEGKHEYVSNGIKLPSVTQILGAVGMHKDLDKIPKHILEIAAERGQYVHRIIELHELGTLDESTVDPALIGYYNAYISCVKEKPEVFGGLCDFEKIVRSEKYGYCGTLDAGGNGWIIDYKTTKTQSPAHGLQLTGYWMAEHPDFINDKPKGLADLYLHENGEYQFVVRPYEPLQWLSCLSVFNWMRKNGVTL